MFALTLCLSLACRNKVPDSPIDSETETDADADTDADSDADSDTDTDVGPSDCRYEDLPEMSASSAELPRERVDTTWALPSGSVHSVAAGDDLQAVFDAAQPGDLIVLDADATFTGNFTLEDKEGEGWIYVLSSTYEDLPEGQRVDGSEAMPTLLSETVQPALRFAPGSHHWRFVGIEVTTSHESTAATHWNLVLAGWSLDGSTAAQSVEDLPHHIVFDRCHLHGNASGNVRTGLGLNASHAAVIHSRLEDFHEVGADAQAIMAWNGSGPYKIVDNYLSASSENVMFGGDPVQSEELIPSDIEVCDNTFYKPLRWKAGHESHDGSSWLIKNLFELKNARRVLVHGNTFENNWTHGQDGTAILFTPRAHDGSPESGVEDVTFVGNRITSVVSGFNLYGEDNTSDTRTLKRVHIEDVLLEDLSHNCYVVSTPDRPMEEVSIVHTTCIHSGNGNAHLAFQGYPVAVEDFVFRDNLLSHGEYGLAGTGMATGAASLEAFAPDADYSGNVLYGPIRNEASHYPEGNHHPQSVEEVGFEDFEGGDYSLSSDSPYAGVASDGADPGADLDRVPQ